MDSSSPSIPSRPNPKPRNSETGDLMRRSFRASPFPGKTTRADSGDKENNKDQISDAVKTLPKSAKNFMSPTISAVSKINPSPRKKILSDKNELSRSFDKTTHHPHPQVRSSVTFSDVVSFIGEEAKEQDGEKKKLEEESHDDVTVTDMDDTNFDVSPLPTSVPYTFPVFESREVDPSVTPYDPKKNYLSPRPQFLHYRPNPRIECKQQLDGLFSSESSSTDDTGSSAEESRHEEEEVVSQESVEEEEEAVESQQVETVASEEEVEERQHVEEVTCQEGVVAVAEVTLDEYDDEEHLEAVESEEAEETHQVSKRSHFKTSKLLGWVLVLGVAYTLLVSSVTLTLPNNIKEGSDFYEKFHIPPEITKSARESFGQLSEKLGMWAGSSLVYMDKLISSLREEEEGYGPFQFHNLTGVLEETRLSSDAVFLPASGKISVAGSQVDSQDWSSEMDTEEESGVTLEERSGEIDLEAVYEEDGNEMEKESEGGEADSEMVYEVDKKKAEITVATDSDSLSEEEEEESVGQETDGVEEQREYEENDQKNLEEGHESETTSAQNDEKMMEESESNPHHLDAEEPAAISEHQQEEASALANLESVPEEGGTAETAETSLDISAEASDVDGNDLQEETVIGEEVVVNAEDWKDILLNNQKKVIVLVSTVMVMLAAAFLLANKKAKPAMHEENEPTTVPDAEEVNFEQAPVENLIKERLSTLNFQEEEEEEVNDDRKREEVSSFPSEMSFSFHKDKSLRSCSNRDELKEYQSGGRKSNDSGESMASSASEYSIGGGSVSYGSFTTYEKIQKRSGRKEEEVMVTPVRRSSRIRNHQHSGQ